MRPLLLLTLSAACAAPAAAPVLDESERGVDVGADLHVASHNGPGRHHTVRSVKGDDPGESDLVLDGHPLAPAPGPDDLPLLVSADGTADGSAHDSAHADASAVVFVSGRSGVASLWRVDLDGTHLRQLTNTGMKPGHLDAGFVPPPARAMQVVGNSVQYDDGAGRVWRIDLASGAVLR